jgi:hypothetical protein
VAVGKRLAAARDAWICLQDEAGQVLRPQLAKTWARRGHTPVVDVSDKGSGRVAIAGVVCLNAGDRGRLMWRTRLHRGRTGQRGSFSEDDYIAFLDPAHQWLRPPIVLIWDKTEHPRQPPPTHTDPRPDWLTVIRLPSYA